MRKTELAMLPKTDKDDIEKLEEIRKKMEAQRKWKEIWDAESHLRRIKCTIDYQRKDPISIKQFSPPIDPTPDIRSPLVSMRNSRCNSMPRSNTQNLVTEKVHKKGVFITSGEDELQKVKTSDKKGKSEMPKRANSSTAKKLVTVRKYVNA